MTHVHNATRDPALTAFDEASFVAIALIAAGASKNYLAFKNTFSRRLTNANKNIASFDWFIVANR
jgi:hypothetical protein